MDIFSRTKLLIGEDNVKKLANSKVAIFGIGGVGSFVCEGLVRGGVANFILVDKDTISDSNINRQIHATTKTIGKDKVEVEKQRILDINPKATVESMKIFYLPDTNADFLDNSVDYIVDAVDNVTAKISLVLKAQELNIPIISCMGTGNKLDPTKFKIDDIYKTSVCPLAKVMRKELKARGVKKLKVLYSTEKPIKTGNRTPASISFVPSVAGMIIAGEVIKDLIKSVKK